MSLCLALWFTFCVVLMLVLMLRVFCCILPLGCCFCFLVWDFLARFGFLGLGWFVILLLFVSWWVVVS